MNKMFRFVRNQRTAVVGSAAAIGGSAFAAGADFSAITTAVDWSTVVTAILAIAALKAAPKVVSVGAGMVLRMIGR